MIVNWRPTLLLLLAAAAAWTPEALACSCVVPGPPCQAAWRADAVFSGTVRSVELVTLDLNRPDFNSHLVTFDVDRVFVNALLGQVRLITGSGEGDCGYRFVKGRRYLVYASKTSGPLLTTGICSRTRPVEQAQEDLAYLATIGNLPAGARVYGRVTHMQREPYEAQVIDYGPMENLSVSLRGAALARDAVTDRNGRFEFTGVPAGRMTVSIAPPPDFDPRHLEREFEIKDTRACVAHDFEIQRVAAAFGSVVDAAGRPLAGVLVDAVAAELAGHLPPPYQQPATTDASGRFLFDELPPGAYVFGVNLTKRRASQAAGQPIYFPGTLSAGEATTIELRPGDRVNIGELRAIAR